MNRFRRSALSYLAAFSAACATAIAIAAPVETYSFSIPTQDLDSALRAFARQARQQVVFDGATVQHETSGALVGSYTVDAALHILLADSGLKATRSEPGVLMVRRASSREAAEADAASTGTTTNGVEEVIVSAQKQGEERLQDVPIPMTALSAQKLADNGQQQLREYFSSIPGLNLVPDIQGSQNLAIRGVTTGRASTPTVGVVVDDVPFGFSLYGFGSLPDFDPSDLAQIEVLRGPQGSLYGSSSMGGLIKYVTAQPSMGGYDGQVSAGALSIRNGDGLGYNLRASTNVPLGDTFAIRASGYTRENPGYINNPITGKEGVNTVDVSGGHLTMLWQPSDVISLKLSTRYQRTDADGLPEVDVLPGLGDLQQALIPGVGQYETTLQAHSVVIDVKLGSADLTSISGYNITQFSDAWDGSAIQGANARRYFGVTNTAHYDDIEATKYSQEIRLAAPLGRKFEAMLGAFYTHERYLQALLRHATTPAGIVVGTLGETAENTLTTHKEIAAFANLTYHITDRFDVQIGGRQSRATIANVRGLDVGPMFPGGQNLVTPIDATGNVFTYLVTPRFKVTPDVMVYGRMASGYRPGGPNVFGYLPGVPGSYESDETQTYELGVKGDFLDRRISVDASLYYIDWKDFQVQVNAPVGGYRTNGSGAKSEGVEFAATLRPLTGLTIDGWVAYNNAVLTEAFPPFSPLFGVPGDRLPFSSRQSGSLSVQQEFPLARMTGFVAGAVSYVGDRISNFRGAGAARQYFPPYARTDLRAGVQFDAWTVNLFLNNVTDKRGVLSENHYVLYRTTYIQPRTVGLNLVKTF